MSTEIEARLCTNPSIDRRPLPGLAGLIDALTASWGSELQFDGYRVKVQGRMSPVASSRDRMTAEQLLATLSDWDSPNFGLGTRTILHVPSVDIGRSQVRERDIVMWLESFGGQRAVRTGDWWLDGDASFSIDPVTPYVFPVGDVGSDNVSSNVAALTRFIRHAIGVLRPESVKVYTDAGELLPFNAHMVYWRGREALVRDIETIVRLFTEGLPVLELAPLARMDDATHEFAFHLWRNRRQRQSVHASLMNAVTSYDTSSGIALPPRCAMDDDQSDGVLVAGEAPFNGFLDDLYVRTMHNN